MVSKTMIIGFLAMVMLSIVGCTTPPVSNEIPTLEGIWITSDGLEFIFTNNTFEILFSGSILHRGTYSINGRIITTRVEYAFFSDDFAFFELAEGLYSKEQLRAAIEYQLVDEHLTTEQFQEFFERDMAGIFSETINFFSIRGNTLLLDWYDWPILLDRKN